MKKLPSIYKQEINKNITNNNTVYYSTTKDEKQQQASSEIEMFIGNLFKEGGHIFNKPLLITTNNRVYDTAIATRNGNKLCTLSGEVILIGDIVKIEKK